MVQSYKSGRFFRVGHGLKFVKIFRSCIQNFFITLRVTIFFFRGVDFVVLTASVSEVIMIFFS